MSRQPGCLWNDEALTAARLAANLLYRIFRCVSDSGVLESVGTRRVSGSARLFVGRAGGMELFLNRHLLVVVTPSTDLQTSANPAKIFILLLLWAGQRPARGSTNGTAVCRRRFV